MVECCICQGEENKGEMEIPRAYYAILKVQGLGE